MGIFGFGGSKIARLEKNWLKYVKKDKKLLGR